MLRSIRAEWYKAVRRPYFPILFLTCTLLTVGAVYCLYLIKTQSPGITPIGLPFALSLSPLGMVLGLWLVAIGGDLVFSEQYKHHTLKNEVSFGHPPGQDLPVPLGRRIPGHAPAVCGPGGRLRPVRPAPAGAGPGSLRPHLRRRLPSAGLSVPGRPPHLGPAACP